jgi:hypothetical protein
LTKSFVLPAIWGMLWDLLEGDDPWFNANPSSQGLEFAM